MQPTLRPLLHQRFSVATVVATRKEFLGLNGLPWNTWKAKIAG